MYRYHILPGTISHTTSLQHRIVFYGGWIVYYCLCADTIFFLEPFPTPLHYNITLYSMGAGLCIIVCVQIPYSSWNHFPHHFTTTSHCILWGLDCVLVCVQIPKSSWKKAWSCTWQTDKYVPVYLKYIFRIRDRLINGPAHETKNLLCICTYM